MLNHCDALDNGFGPSVDVKLQTSFHHKLAESQLFHHNEALPQLLLIPLFHQLLFPFDACCHQALEVLFLALSAAFLVANSDTFCFEFQKTGKSYITGVIAVSTSLNNNSAIVLKSDIISYGESSVVAFQYLSAHSCDV